MESIGDILAGKRIDEPPEAQIIKRYIRETYYADSLITVQTQQIIIQVKGAALAGALRPQIRTMQRLCDTTKRLVIRIQ